MGLVERSGTAPEFPGRYPDPSEHQVSVHWHSTGALPDVALFHCAAGMGMEELQCQ